MAEARGGMNRFYLLLGGIAVAGLGVITYLAVGRGHTVSIPANVVVQPADTSGFEGYYLGSDSAPVEITEYADFQCPACQQFATLQFPVVEKQLIATGKVRWRYRDYPLDNAHPYARLVAHAAACANEQGKYWDFARLIYDGQFNWSSSTDPGSIFRGYGRSLGLDLGSYDACMKSARYAGRIQASLQEGTALGVQSTPTFLINGRLYPGALPSDVIVHVVDSLLQARQPQ